MSTAALVPAAGLGVRLGPGGPKALRLLAGEPLVVHAVAALLAARGVGLVVVAAPPGERAATAALLADRLGESAPVRVVTGGTTRQESVLAALAVLPAEVDVVLVHDAGRPLAPPELAEEVAAAVRAGAPAVVPALPVTDTVKRVDPSGRVVETLRRAELWAVQTPQGFRRDVLDAAHGLRSAGALPRSAAPPGPAATDDAGLVEALGFPVSVVPGREEAFKVTRPFDLVVAEAVLAGRTAGGGEAPGAPGGGDGPCAPGGGGDDCAAGGGGAGRAPGGGDGG